MRKLAVFQSAIILGLAVGSVAQVVVQQLQTVKTISPAIVCHVLKPGDSFTVQWMLGGQVSSGTFIAPMNAAVETCATYHLDSMSTDH